MELNTTEIDEQVKIYRNSFQGESFKNIHYKYIMKGSLGMNLLSHKSHYQGRVDKTLMAQAGALTWARNFRSEQRRNFWPMFLSCWRCL